MEYILCRERAGWPRKAGARLPGLCRLLLLNAERAAGPAAILKAFRCAIERIEHALEQVDDSSGEASGVLADYLAALRIQYKPKRHFIKLLDDLSSTRF